MEQSQRSGSVSGNKQTRCGPICKCGRSTTTILKAWTNKNSGRRFFKCNAHGFVSWADENKPHGWQKLSLLEARDEIRHMKEEIKVLKKSIKARNSETASGTRTVDSATVNSDLWTEEKKKKLEDEAMVSKEREKLLRQFIVISWGGFIVVVGMILAMKK